MSDEPMNRRASDRLYGRRDADADNAQINLGQVASAFRAQHPADDFARCLRYYEIVAGNFQGYSLGATANMWIPLKFAVRKAGTPTVTRTAGTIVNVNSVTTTNITQESFVMAVQGTAAGNTLVNGDSFACESNP